MLIYSMIKLIQLLMRVHKRLLFVSIKNNKHIRQINSRNNKVSYKPFTKIFKVVQGMHIQSFVMFLLQIFFLSNNMALEKVSILSIF